VLPEYIIHRAPAYAFANRTKGREVKEHFLIDGERSLNKALNQALKLQAAKVTARP
jgi:hypothetical protein